MCHCLKYKWSCVTLSSVASAILNLLLLEHLAVQTLGLEVKKRAFLNFNNLVLMISSAVRLLYLVE
jgi:hypothetical protein